MNSSSGSSAIKRFHYVTPRKEKSLPEQWSRNVSAQFQAAEKSTADSFGLENVWSVRKNVDVYPLKENHSSKPQTQVKRGYSRHESGNELHVSQEQPLKDRLSLAHYASGSKMPITQISDQIQKMPRSCIAEGRSTATTNLTNKNNPYSGCLITPCHQASMPGSSGTSDQRIDQTSDSPFDF